MKEILLIAVLVLSPALAEAGVTLNSAFGVLSDQAGDPLATNSTLVLLADMEGDGFGDLTQATSNWTDDGDDVVLERFGSNDLAGLPGTHYEGIVFNNPAAAGKKMMLVWYDLAFDVLATGPGGGTDFGTFRTDDANPGEGSSIGWFVPNDGFTEGLNILTQSLGGAAADSAYPANQTTVPEPATLALLGLGGPMIARRRKA